MSLMRAGLRPALALLIVAHTLGHALLPQQPFLSPASLVNDAGPAILLGIAALGFTIAALAVIGVWPFVAVGRAAMVLASAYSLIAIWRMGQGDMWWGVPVDVALLVTGLTGLYQRLPRILTVTPRQGSYVATERRLV